MITLLSLSMVQNHLKLELAGNQNYSAMKNSDILFAIGVKNIMVANVL